MIEPIEDMPAGTIGFRVEGELTDTDYETVLAPGLKAAAGSGEVRLMMLGTKGFDLGSFKSRFEEARSDPDLDLGHSKDWCRVAVVADTNFVIRAAFPAVAKAIPVDVKLFPLDEEPEARAWIAD